MLTVLLATFLMLVASLVLYWLGWSWQGGLLLLAFFFSLRHLLFARSIRLSDKGLAVSHPLTGARVWDWDVIERLECRLEALYVVPRGKRAQTLPLPEKVQRGLLQEWVEWFAGQSHAGEAGA